MVQRSLKVALTCAVALCMNSVAFCQTVPIRHDTPSDQTVALSLPFPGDPGEREVSLVLYLFNPPDQPTVIERAAITLGPRVATTTTSGTRSGGASRIAASDSDANQAFPDSQIEIQELPGIDGQPFYRSAFRTRAAWLKDVNGDGFQDLTLKVSENRRTDMFMIYLFDPSSQRFVPKGSVAARTDAL